MAARARGEMRVSVRGKLAAHRPVLCKRIPIVMNQRCIIMRPGKRCKRVAEEETAVSVRRLMCQRHLTKQCTHQGLAPRGHWEGCHGVLAHANG